MMGVVSASVLVRSRFAAIQPLPIFTAPGPAARLNLVTDSISVGSLFGGVGTAIILASQVASRRGAKLRIVTRTEVADEAAVRQVLDCNDLAFPGNVEFAQVQVGDEAAQLDVCAGDRFLTTSWWTTASTLGSVAPEKVDYLLQEDERMFYPYGDDWIRCQEVLSRTDIRFVINTELLFDHLVASGLGNLRDCARWFEPAFPATLFHMDAEAEARPEGGKRRLFFYARPNNARNLFFRGIEALDRAVAEGVVDPEQWEIVLVGKDVPKIQLGGVVEPTVLPTMNWREYGKFIRGVDLGFCLMSTPHPSYPPLDLAASGAVVLTNRFGLKTDLSGYSTSILCSDLGVTELLQGLREGVRRAGDAAARRDAYARSQMPRSWVDTMATCVEFLG
ncbi:MULTISPECIES: rhamnosyltransferase WsaF family glycosyltransferase [unclassified Rhodanobacter]|uniref:Glycosyl transferase family 1 n=1 Tax=Rhodanobacter humi TaxID=1888173 RepID=A0ABV4AUX5_9GAMM